MSDSLSAQPVQASASRRWLFFLALFFLVLAGGTYYWYRQAASGEAAGGQAKGGARLSPIVVDQAVSANFPVRLSAIGTVIPRSVVTVRSRVDGTLNRINFKEGQTVRAGQLLAEIDPRSYEVALTQVQGQMAKDAALLANARADLARYEGLAKLDAIPAQQLDTQRALVRQYEASVRVDQGAVDNARLQLSYTRITAPSDGRAGLRQVDPGNLVRSSDANGIVVITQVQPVTVVFPIPEADLGQLLNRLGRQTKHLEAGAGQSSEDSPRRRAAGRSKAEHSTTEASQAQGSNDAQEEGRSPLAVEAWDRDGKVLLATGELLTVDNQLDVTTGTVKVKAIFANKDGALFPNQFVNVRLIVNELKDVVVIPSAAVQRGAKGAFVWLLKEDKTVAMRPVEFGTADGDRIPVLNGLRVGESVAVDGFDRLREGAKVEVVSRDSRSVKEGPGKAGGLRSDRRGDRRGDWRAEKARQAAAAPTAPGTSAKPAGRDSGATIQPTVRP